MSVQNHHRQKIVSEAQHLYEHGLFEFAYANDALPPGLSNSEQAMDYIFEVLYPRMKGKVATPADLPTGVDTPNLGDVAPTVNDQRIVIDDGDGKAAIYVWAKWDEQATEQWNKMADLDWGEGTVIAGLLDQTQYLYPRKYGTTDYDPITELALVGKLSGQHYYGGDLANQNLTLHANNGDDPGVHTGYVQVDDDFRPYDDLVFDLGSASERWKTGYIGTLVIGTATMTITSGVGGGSITDTTGIISFADENLDTTGTLASGTATITGSAIVTGGVESLTLTESSILSTTGGISFGDENLSTSGTLAAGLTTILADMILGVGSITSVSGAITFGNENLSTTGSFGAGTINGTELNIDNINLNGSTISTTLLDETLNITANGTGVVNFIGPVVGDDATWVGDTVITGSLQVDNITINGSSINSAGTLFSTNSSIQPVGNLQMGLQASPWQFGHFTNFRDPAGNVYSITELMEFRSATYRDVARTQPAQAGDALFYDAVNSLYLASAPDSEIDHATLSGLTTTDAGHTQFALLAGRAGGQVVHGGTLVSEELVLGPNAVTGSTLKVGVDGVYPNSNGAYDLGAAGSSFDDLYLSGEAIGIRLENATVATAGAAAAAGTPGRVWYTTDDQFIYLDKGGTVKKIGHNTYNQLHAAAIFAAPITVSATITDARNAIWQLTDISNNEEVLGVEITKSATQVTVTTDITLPAGNYRLLGIEL